MPFVGAFLGGTGGAIPAGYGELNLSWVTSDGENLTPTTFILSGPENITISANQNGFASKIVKSGDYLVSVEHAGEYLGDSPKNITVPNRESVGAVWFASRKYKRTIVFLSPINSSSTSYSLNDEDGEVLHSGSSWSASMQFQLYTGSYTLTLNYANDSVTIPFDVVDEDKTIELAEWFCKVTINQPIAGVTLSISYNGYSMGAVSSFYVLKTTETRTIIYSGIPNYTGVSSSKIATVPDSSVIPSGESLTISPVATGSIVTISSSSGGPLYVPIEGDYHVLVIGGGAGGSTSYGGGSGRAVDEILHLSHAEYPITIGAGGAGQSGNGTSPAGGGASSFGTLLSASGGSTDGSGGAGGGGAASRAGGTGDNFGGGGGAAGNGSTNTYAGGTGVTADGGHGGAKEVSAANGETGVTSSDSFYGTDSAGGGSYGSGRGGGGGGGGLNARGGAGGSGSTSYSWRTGGGGGGGGVAGGTGGAGGAGAAYNTFNGGKGGYGYGAGGGGSGGSTNQSSNGSTGGGGGGGGLASVFLSSNGGTSRWIGGSGARGAVRIQWVG